MCQVIRPFPLRQLGIHFFRNAAFGGDWILQENIKNAAWLNLLLPTDPPLSTMRVITTSSWALDNAGQPEGVVEQDPRFNQYVRALSSVLRLGRSAALTDHSSILFDVDIATGAIPHAIEDANEPRQSQPAPISSHASACHLKSTPLYPYLTKLDPYLP